MANLTNLFANLADLTDAVKDARAEAEREARREGRKVSCPFVRSRGTFLIAAAKGQRVIDEAQAWDGSKRDLLKFIDKAIERGADEVVVEGGYDWSDTFDFYDYEPWATNWQVQAWTRETVVVPTLQVETTSTLMPTNVALALADAVKQTNLDAVERILRAALPDCFIYRGGSHVAVHLSSSQPRLFMVTER